MKWLREPLTHFLLIGAALFGLFAIFGGPTVPPPGQYSIVLTPAMVQNIALSYQNLSQHPPTAAQLSALIDDYVREEILDREARAQGLDLDDPLIRQQLRQKMEFFLEDSAVVAPPTDAQLQAFLQKNGDSLRRPDGTLPPLADVRDAVQAAWQADQRRQIANAAYQKLRARYVVVIQPPVPATTPAPVSNTTAK
jgi:hypothetical protein